MGIGGRRQLLRQIRQHTPRRPAPRPRRPAPAPRPPAPAHPHAAPRGPHTTHPGTRGTRRRSAPPTPRHRAPRLHAAHAPPQRPRTPARSRAPTPASHNFTAGSRGRTHSPQTADCARQKTKETRWGRPKRLWGCNGEGQGEAGDRARRALASRRRDGHVSMPRRHDNKATQPIRRMAPRALLQGRWTAGRKPHPPPTAHAQRGQEALRQIVWTGAPQAANRSHAAYWSTSRHNARAEPEPHCFPPLTGQKCEELIMELSGLANNKRLLK